MSSCKYTFTDEGSGRLFEFASEDAMFDFLQEKKLNKNINDLVNSLDSLKDSGLVKAFENIKIFLNASYSLEWFNALRHKFPELKEASSRRSSLNKGTTDETLKQAQSIVAFLQSGIVTSEAIKKHFIETMDKYKDNPIEIYNQLFDANNFAVAYLDVVGELKNYFILNDIPDTNDVYVALTKLERNLSFIKAQYNNKSFDHVVNTLYDVFKNMDISGNNVNILSQLSDINEQLVEANKLGDVSEIKRLEAMKDSLEGSHPELEARKGRVITRLKRAKEQQNEKLIDKYTKELKALNNKRITKDLIKQILLGKGGDVGILSAYLESAGMSGDPIVSAMQKILNTHQRNIRKQGILIQDTLDTFQQRLFTLNGGNKNNLKESYKDLYQWVNILSFDENGEEVVEKRLALMTTFNWEFLNAHKRLKRAYSEARKTAETAEEMKTVNELFKNLKSWERENLELPGNEEFYKVFDNISLESREALDEVNAEITLFDHMHKNQLNLTVEDWKDYKRLQLKKANLYSKYDAYTGKEKTGKELAIAEELSSYREKVNGLFNDNVDNLEGAAKWEKNRSVFESILSQRLSDGLINEEDYKFQLSVWHQKNSLASYTDSFIEERTRIYNRLAELSSKKAARVEQLRLDLATLRGSRQAKDDQNQIIGDLYTEAQAAKIKEIQEELETLRLDDGEVSTNEKVLFNKIIQKYGLPAYWVDRIGIDDAQLKGEMTPEDFENFKRIDLKIQNSSANGNKKEIFELIKELDKLQETVNTTYYEEVSANKKFEVEQSTVRNTGETDEEFNKKVEENFKNSSWYLDNHYNKTVWDDRSKGYKVVSKPITIWTVTRPKKQEDIINTPNYKYSKTREIKDSYKNDKSVYDETLKSYLPKESKWKNSNASTNPEVKKLLGELTEYYLNSQKTTTIQNRLGYFLGGKEQELNEALLNSGSIKEKGQKIWSYTKNRFKFAASDKDNGYGLAELSGEPFQFVPVKYNNKLTEEDQSLDVFGNITGYLYDVAQSNEIQKSLPTFKSISKILNENTPESAKQNSLVRGLTLTSQKFVKGDTNYRAQQVEALILTQIYKEYKKRGENRVFSKFVDNVNGFAAFTSLSYNIPSAVVNWVSARIQITIESMSDEFFNYKTWKIGEAAYLNYAKDFMKDFTKSGNKSFISKLVALFDPITGEYSESIEEGFKRTALREIVQNSPANYLRHLGEHEVQISTMLGMLKTRIVTYKGKTTNLLAAYEENFKVTGLMEFAEGDVSYVLNDGGTFSKTMEYTQDSEVNLINKIQSINEGLHGNYSKLNQAMVERYSVGRMAFFFRKFFVPLFAKRFSGLRANIMRDTYTEGFYITFYNSVIKELFNVVTGKERLTNPKNWWTSQTPLQKANLKRAAAEILMILCIYIISSALTALADGDGDGEPDKDANFFLLHAIYLAKRARSETEQFMPVLGANEISKTLTTPSVAYSMHYRNTSNLVKHTIGLLTGEENAYLKQGKGFFDPDAPKVLGDLLKIIGISGNTFHPHELIKGFDYAQRNL